MDGRAAAGSVGPRLAGRLTAELIARSPQYMNCVKYYELDLRGNKVGAIENLGTTQNQFDSIDLSDNAIVRLEGFSRLPRLKVLLLSNNRISKIARGLQDSIGGLEALILTNNRIVELKDLDPLSSLPKLTMLSLIGNPVATKAQYRLYAISRCPKLKVLDFKKVKQKEREEAAKAYGDGEQAAAVGTLAGSGKTFEPGEGLPAAAGGGGTQAAESEAPSGGGGSRPSVAPTAEQITAIKAAVANAQTLEEVQRLEAALREGNVPSEFRFDKGPGVAAGNGAGGAEAMDEG